MALLVDNFAAGQRAVAQQSRAATTRPAAAASKDDGGGRWDWLTGIGDALGGITGQQGSGRSANGNTTAGGSSYAGSPNSRNTSNPVPAPRMYDRENWDIAMPGLMDANNTLAMNRASTDAMIARLMNNQVATNKQFDNSEAAYRSQLAGQLAEAGLNIQAADIPLQYMPQWQSFLAEKWGNAMTAGKADLDFIAKQQVNSADQRLQEWRDIQQGKKVVERQSGVARREATSAAVVSGFIQNAKQDYGDIDAERGEALYELDSADKTSARGAKQRREELSNRRSQLMADLKDFDINTREGQAKLREREQLLQIEAQKARLQPRMLQDAMNVTLANLGLDKVMSTGQFLESLANADGQKQAALNQYLQEANAWLQLVERWQSPVPQANRGSKPANPGKQNYDRGGFR